MIFKAPTIKRKYRNARIAEAERQRALQAADQRRADFLSLLRQQRENGQSDDFEEQQRQEQQQDEANTDFFSLLQQPEENGQSDDFEQQQEEEQQDEAEPMQNAEQADETEAVLPTELADYIYQLLQNNATSPSGGPKILFLKIYRQKLDLIFYLNF